MRHFSGLSSVSLGLSMNAITMSEDLAGTTAQIVGDALPLGFVLLDPATGVIRHINAEAGRLLRLRRVEVLDQPAHAHFPPELTAACSPARWRSLRGARTPARLSLAVTTRAGSIWLKVHLSLLPDGTGMLSLQDAGAERQLERALQESDTRFREVTEAVSECLFVTTPQWDRLHFSSPLLLDMLGMTPLELREGPQRFREHIHPLDRPLYDRRMKTQFEGGSTDILLRVEHRSRGLRWLRLRSRLQTQGSQPLVYAILADVTDEQHQRRELQAARDKAEDASHVKSEIMANLSHEFRTPMNGILGMTDLLLRTSLSDEQRRHAEVTRRCAEDLMRLMEDMLNLSGAGAGPLQALGFAPLDLARAALDRQQEAANAKGLSLQLEAATVLPPLLIGDAERIGQVLDKLLNNAVKFTATGGALLRLDHRCDAGGQHWLGFEISDSGIGLDPAELPRLTQAFTQGDSTLSRRYAGTGLGLALAQQGLALMGGSLAVRPSPLGGASFAFELKVQLPAAPGQAVQSHKPATPVSVEVHRQVLTPHGAPYILVVEDNAVNQEVICQTLAHLGARVRLASHALAGLQALRDERFDLVLMDIQMPDMDGMQALSLFRRSSGGSTPPDTPVVAVTANALQGDDERLLQHGFNDYLPKPFRQSQMQAMLARQLRMSRSAPDSASSSPAAVADILENTEPAASVGDSAHVRHDGSTMSSNFPAPAPGAVLDKPSLDRLRELDPTGAAKLMERVVAAYMASLDRLLPELAAARGATLNLTVIRHISHTLKSSSASLGALQLSERCAEIETMARNGHGEGIEPLLDNMLEEIAQVRVALLALPN